MPKVKQNLNFPKEKLIFIIFQLVNGLDLTDYNINELGKIFKAKLANM